MNYVVPVYQKAQIISTEAYIKKIKLLCVWVLCPDVHMCITCVKYVQRPEEGIGFCGTAVADGSEPWMGAENCQQLLIAGSLLYYFLKMLGIESRASHMPSKCSATKLHTISPEIYFLPRTHTHKCTIEIHLDICSGELAIQVNLDRGISFSFEVLSVLGIQYLDMRSWLEQPNHCPCCLGNEIAFSALIPMNIVAIRIYNPG